MSDLYASAAKVVQHESDTAAMVALRSDKQARRAVHVARLADRSLSATARRDEERAIEDIDDILYQLERGWGPNSPGSLKAELAARGVDIARVQTLPWMLRRTEELRAEARRVRDAQARREAASGMV